MIFPKYLKKIEGYNFAITGDCWIKRSELIKIIKNSGGIVAEKRAQVTLNTNVLIRGHSRNWKYTNYGEKEAKVALLLKGGQKIFIVTDYDFKKLIISKTPARIMDRVAGQPFEWYLPPLKQEKYLEIIKEGGQFDREYSKKGRLEQKYLRELLFGEKAKYKCAICNRLLPVELMVAGHIKQRSECTFKEKKDFYNIVFPVCLLGCDSLYEKGFLGVNQSGFIEVSSCLNSSKSITSFLSRLNGKKCFCWNKNNSKYFSWHYMQKFAR